MKEELLLALSLILNADLEDSIKLHVDEVASIRLRLNEYINDEERLAITNKIKDRVQREAGYYWEKHGSIGAILMATGTGKSKIGINKIRHLFFNGTGNNMKVLLVVPTEKLRDEGWKAEFDKWGIGVLYGYTQRTCYASLNKYEDEEFDLVILDEGHNITPNNAQFFQQNEVKSILWLSATKPQDVIKVQILKALKINPVYEITLDEAVRLGLVAPYEITVVTTKLDNVDKYVKAGNKDKPFFNTEAGNYGYLTRRVIAAPAKFNFIRRMRFVYDLKSKTKAAKWLLDNIIPRYLRTLIFCGGKKQAIELCDYRYFSKPTRPKALKEPFNAAKQKEYMAKLTEYDEMMRYYQGNEGYELFVNKEIARMACVDALNEGHNIPDLDCGLVVQLNSSELDLWQRIGRTIRFRPGHIANIIILACEGTEDIKWVTKATRNLDGANIRWISLEDLQSGKETIKFN